MNKNFKSQPNIENELTQKIIGLITEYKSNVMYFCDGFQANINDQLDRYKVLHAMTYKTDKEYEEYKEKQEYIASYQKAVDNLCKKYNVITTLMDLHNIPESYFKEKDPDIYRLRPLR